MDLCNACKKQITDRAKLYSPKVILSSQGRSSSSYDIRYNPGKPDMDDNWFWRMVLRQIETDVFIPGFQRSVD